MLLEALKCPRPPSRAAGVCAHRFPTEKGICRFPNTSPGSGTAGELGSGARTPAGTVRLSRAINAGTGHGRTRLKDAQEPVPGA